ncbi:MAG: S41 family peptidase [Patescibacteria group bacterium]
MAESTSSIGTGKNRSWVKQALLTLLYIGAIFGAYVGGFSLGREEGLKGGIQTGGEGGKVTNKDAGSSASLLQNADFNLYWDVWKWIQGNFIDKPIDEKKLFYGSLAGMVASLDDPYSAFMEPKQAQEFSEELQGKFQGIGAEIGIRDKKLTVVAPLPETPAELEGLKSGDWIIEIDGTDTTGMMLDDAVNRIRGEKGTQVKLLIMREDFKEPKTFVITRDNIKIVSVRSEVKEGGIGYVQISNFNADTGERFRNAAESMLVQNVKGLVLDLRNDPGGYLSMAVEIASYWVDVESPVVLERSGDTLVEEYRAIKNQALKGIPTVVLINRGSASASEIVAGALQDYALATLIGQQSFGKGSIQEMHDFSDGSAVKLTIARWFTPKNRQIDKEGIAPDVEVDIKEEDITAGKDPQLEKALEILKSQAQSSNAK